MKISLTNEQGVYKKSSFILSSVFSFITAFGPWILQSWEIMPEGMKEVLPTGVSQVIATIAFLVIAVGRYTDIQLGAPKA